MLTSKKLHFMKFLLSFSLLEGFSVRFCHVFGLKFQFNEHPNTLSHEEKKIKHNNTKSI